LIPDQGELALMLEYDGITGTLEIFGYAATKDRIEEFSEQGKMNVFTEQAVLHGNVEDNDREQVLKYMETRDRKEVQFLQEFIPREQVESYQQSVTEALPEEDKNPQNKGDFVQYLGNKYKPAALKVKPVYADLLEKFRVKRDIKGDPLVDMPKLNLVKSVVYTRILQSASAGRSTIQPTPTQQQHQ
jgi:hypothetical protein